MIAPAPMPSTETPQDAIAQWLAGLPEETRRSLARQLAVRTRELGLVVVRPTGDVDIPVTLTPEIVSEAAVAERAREAADILLGVIRTVRSVLTRGLDTPQAKRLFGYFGAFEARCLANWRTAEDVTIARVDWFLDESGAHRALELNATIPAMEAYSDAAARAWVETIGAAAGLSRPEIEELLQANGSNAEELRRSIVAHAGYPADARPSIAILHREGDPQLRELQALARHFTAAGHTIALATPPQVSVNAQGQAVVEGIPGGPPDILYRHIFARRIPEGSALERIAAGETKARLQNPVNGQHEVKGVLAELSRILAEEHGGDLGLSEEQRERLLQVVPWTRLLSRDRSLTPQGERVASLAEFVAANPTQFVLKRSWDYGGKSVHLGPDVFAAEGLEGWKKRVDEALAEGDGAFVVQSLVVSPRKRHLLAAADGSSSWEDVFVDASTYTATGQHAVPGGGVARFARTGIVNIVGGGGVSPLIKTSVAQRIAARLRPGSPR